MLKQISSKFENFRNDQSGAVAVDWVVLTAVSVVMAIAAVSALGDHTKGTGMYQWLFYSEYMLGEYVPTKLGYQCGYFDAYFSSGC